MMRASWAERVDRYMNYIDRASISWGVVAIVASILIFGPIVLKIFWK